MLKVNPARRVAIQSPSASALAPSSPARRRAPWLPMSPHSAWRPHSSWRRRLRSFGCAAACAALSACGGGGDASPPSSPPPIVTPGPGPSSTQRVTLTVAAGTGGSVSVAFNGADVGTVAGASSEVTATVEDTVTLTAKPAPGYRFTTWGLPAQGSLACLEDVNNPDCTLSGIASTATVTASFALRRRLTFDVAAANGSPGGAVAYAYAGPDSAVGSPTTATAGTAGLIDIPVAGAHTTVTLWFAPRDGLAYAGVTGDDSPACAYQPVGLGMVGYCAVSLPNEFSWAWKVRFVPAADMSLWSLTVGDGGLDSGGALGSVAYASDAAADYPILSRRQGAGSGAWALERRSGQSVTFEAMPADGHLFAGWSGACTDEHVACRRSLEPPRSVTVTSLTATFLPERRVTVQVVATAGMLLDAPVVSILDRRDFVQAQTSFQNNAPTAPAVFSDGQGRRVTLRADYSDAEFVFDGWTDVRCDGDDPVAARLLPSCDFSLGTTDITASATFTPKRQLNLNFRGSASGSGNVTAEWPENERTRSVILSESGSLKVPHGATLTLTAAPDSARRHFVGWADQREDPGVCADAGRGLCLLALTNALHILDATFEMAYDLSVSSAAGGLVAVALNGADLGTVAADASTRLDATAVDTVMLTATPTDSYVFDRWTLSPSSLACMPAASSRICTLSGITADGSAAAAFRLRTFALTVAAGANGAVAVSVSSAAPLTVAASTSMPFEVVPATAVQLTVDPDVGYEFAGWTLSPNSLACNAGASNPICTLSAPAEAASASAAFRLRTFTLTVTAGANGAVEVSVGSDTLVTVTAGMNMPFSATIADTVTLTAVPATGYDFIAWTGACINVLTSSCMLPVGAVGGNLAVGADFRIPSPTLAVSAGAGGSVMVVVGAAAPVAVTTGNGRILEVPTTDAVTLTAVPATGFALHEWTLLPTTLQCAVTSAANVCQFPAGEVSTLSAARATFEAQSFLLTVTAANGAVTVSVGSAMPVTVAGTSMPFNVSVADTVTLQAAAEAGYAFDGWALSPSSLTCREGPASPMCTLSGIAEAASASANLRLQSVAFTVDAATGGAVTVTVGSAMPVTVDAGTSAPFSVTVADTVTLQADAEAGYEFDGWTGACAGETSTNCTVSGAALLGASAAARFERPAQVGQEGPGQLVYVPGSAEATVTPYAAGAFAGWRGPGSACDASTSTRCAVARGDVITARFHPWVPAGIKWLAFGLEYPLSTTPARWQISRREPPGNGGFTVLDGFDDIMPGPALIHVPLAVHFDTLSTYLSESCDATSTCTAPERGEAQLGRDTSLAVTGYFKAPHADFGDGFASAIALSADGATLVASAALEDSSAVGTFTSADAAYASALGDDNTPVSGAAYVYSAEPSGAWRLDTYIKGPAPDAFDRFGSALALSGSGVLAISAIGEDSQAAGVFMPSNDDDYHNAINDNHGEDTGAVHLYERELSEPYPWAVVAFVTAPNGENGDAFGESIALSADGDTLAVGAPQRRGRLGAVYIYSRSSTGQWQTAQYIEAPNADRGDRFGGALALADDGATLAVGAAFESGRKTGIFVPSDDGYQDALDNNAFAGIGAVYVYSRSSTGSLQMAAYIKAPNAGITDQFGAALALSGSGQVLAVGATLEDSGETGVFVPGGDGDGYQDALDGGGKVSGAVYVYRVASPGAAWNIDAFIKAPNADAGDAFGESVALSADGAALAVGATGEDSNAVGVFVSPDVGYMAALNNNSHSASGAVYVYRALDGGSWELTAYVKPPGANSGNDGFASVVALSGSGTTLAVGAPQNDSMALPAPQAWGAAVDGGTLPTTGTINSGAAYLY